MSNADCEYPNPCGCGCQDEPVRPGCKCCGREAEHSDDCLIPENARLRARIAELEGSIVALEEEHSDLIGKHNETIAERDLLAALVALVKVIDRADDRECPAAALEMARAAIQKAEGK